MVERNIKILSTYSTKKNPTPGGIAIFAKNLGESIGGINGNKITYAGLYKENAESEGAMDLPINIYDRKSWENAENKILNSKINFLASQYEFGFDPKIKNGKIIECEGDNFVRLAKKLKDKEDFVHFVYLHTVRDKTKAKDFEIKRLQDIAKYSDKLIVTTDGAVKTLSSAPYNIPKDKIERIYHGIRVNEEDKADIKKMWGIENIFIASQLGLKSLNKGNEYFIQALGQFVNNSLDKRQRKRFVGCIAGGLHPNFIKQDGGKYVQIYNERIAEALKRADIKYQEVKNIKNADWESNDLIILDQILPEKLFKQFYKASDIIVIPYPDLDQVSSGIFFDVIGSANVPITTKIQCAYELLNPNMPKKKGVVVTKRGVLVDPKEKSINQIARSLDYLVFNEDKRLKMSEENRILGHRMTWPNVAWEALQHYKIVIEEKNKTRIPKLKFSRAKKSPLKLRVGK